MKNIISGCLIILLQVISSCYQKAEPETYLIPSFYIDRQYYSVDSEGKRTPLSIFEFKHFKKDSAEYIINDVHQKGIFGDCTSGTLGNMHIFFQDFTVCSYNQFDSFFTKEYQKQFDYKLEQATTLTLQLE